METTKKNILKVLLKDLSTKPVMTSLAEEVRMSRVGAWKVLKKLEQERLITTTPVGKGKTSARIIRINWENPLSEKTLSLALGEEASTQQRWLSNFAALSKMADFLVLYGSIINSPKEADDIDIIAVTGKDKFLEIEKAVMKIQKTQAKAIHALYFTRQGLKDELGLPNNALVDAIKKGVILYGQDSFVRFMRGVSR
ncbi:MAG: hypothetical protein KJ709_02905 [Nanoarchaeota archaeon]|nr:hypothetical protein [Nanoarchaeota archaeon]